MPVPGQAEKLVRVRRELSQTDRMTRLEQIEHEAKLRADEITGKAEAEAERLVATARQEAENIRAKARQDGDLAAKREALQKIAALITTLQAEISELQKSRQDFMRANLDGIIDFSCSLASKVLLCELNTRPKAVAERAAALIDRMPHGPKLILTVSSHDLDVIETYLHEAGGPSDVLMPVLRSDPDIEPGSIRIESDNGYIHAKYLEALEELGCIISQQARELADMAPETGDVDDS